MNTKNNQRFHDTEMRIQKTLFELLKTQELRQVTVRTVCEKSCINRSTFYAHYTDIYDLAEKAGREMMSGIIDLFHTADDALTFFLTEEYLVQLISYIKENKDFYDIFLNHCPPSVINSGFSQLWEVSGKPYMEAFGLKDESEMWYHFTFFKAGFLAILSEWLQKGCTEMPEKIASIVLRNLPDFEH